MEHIQHSRKFLVPHPSQYHCSQMELLFGALSHLSFKLHIFSYMYYFIYIWHLTIIIFFRFIHCWYIAVRFLFLCNTIYFSMLLLIDIWVLFSLNLLWVHIFFGWTALLIFLWNWWLTGNKCLAFEDTGEHFPITYVLLSYIWVFAHE